MKRTQMIRCENRRCSLTVPITQAVNRNGAWLCKECAQAVVVPLELITTHRQDVPIMQMARRPNSLSRFVLAHA